MGSLSSVQAFSPSRRTHKGRGTDTSEYNCANSDYPLTSRRTRASQGDLYHSLQAGSLLSLVKQRDSENMRATGDNSICGGVASRNNKLEDMSCALPY